MEVGARRGTPGELDSLAGVARVARALVGIGGLQELGRDAMVEIREALELEAAALYVAGDPGSGTLRCIERRTTARSLVEIEDVVSLDAAAWAFLAASGGPLVFRESTAMVMQNPFRPPLDDWVILPLVSQRRMLGAIVGCSAHPISLEPAAVARLTVIGDLLSAGAENALLRTEIRRTELQRERLRLAEEIHDSLAQDLAAAVRELALLEARPPEEIARASEDRLREAVRDAHRVVRRHLDVLAGEALEGGLQAGVEEICARFGRRGLAVACRVDVPFDVDSVRVAVVLRVLNEALANVHRHAGVSEADVAVRADTGGLLLSVADRGSGFEADSTSDAGSGHFGLAIMRRRARDAGGKLEVDSRPGQGTTVTLWLPPSQRIG